MSTVTEEDELIDFIECLGDRCSQIADEIKNRICRKAIRVINNWKGNMTIAGHTVHWRGKDCLRDGDYPNNFNFFDILSIQIQDYIYEEINPYLEESIEAVLANELSKVTPSERVVLEYSLLHEVDDYEDVYDESKLIGVLFSRFHEMLNEHWSTSKKIGEWSLRH